MLGRSLKRLVDEACKGTRGVDQRVLGPVDAATFRSVEEYFRRHDTPSVVKNALADVFACDATLVTEATSGEALSQAIETHFWSANLRPISDNVHMQAEVLTQLDSVQGNMKTLLQEVTNTRARFKKERDTHLTPHILSLTREVCLSRLTQTLDCLKLMAQLKELLESYEKQKAGGLYNRMLHTGIRYLELRKKLYKLGGQPLDTPPTSRSLLAFPLIDVGERELLLQEMIKMALLDPSFVGEHGDLIQIVSDWKGLVDEVTLQNSVLKAYKQVYDGLKTQTTPLELVIPLLKTYIYLRSNPEGGPTPQLLPHMIDSVIEAVSSRLVLITFETTDLPATLQYCFEYAFSYLVAVAMGAKRAVLDTFRSCVEAAIKKTRLLFMVHFRARELERLFNCFLRAQDYTLDIGQLAELIPTSLFIMTAIDVQAPVAVELLSQLISRLSELQGQEIDKLILEVSIETFLKNAEFRTLVGKLQGRCSWINDVSLHRVGDTYIHHTGETRSLSEYCKRMFIASLLLGDPLLFLDSSEHCIYRCLRFSVDKTSPFGTHLEKHARRRTQQVLQALRVGSSTAEYVSMAMSDYATFLQGVLVGINKPLNLTASIAEDYRVLLQRSECDVVRLLILKNFLSAANVLVERGITGNASTTVLASTLVEDIGKYSSDTSINITLPLSPSPQLVNLRGSMNPTEVRSKEETTFLTETQTMAELLLKGVAHVLKTVQIQVFNIPETMATHIKAAIPEYKREASPDKSAPTSFSAKLVSTLKNTFYLLNFGCIATPSEITTEEAQSIHSVLTLSTPEAYGCSLYHFYFYKTFARNFSEWFVSAAATVPQYTGFGRSCLLHDYCAVQAFLTGVLPDFCLDSSDIQASFASVREYIELYFSTPEEVMEHAEQKTYTIAQIIALLRTGLSCHLPVQSIETYITNLPGGF
ncbi:hypothetical protein GMRT_11458 [Giardia muris]|uniref:Uncharacterized protein n=1 Tax=Giardia muris TaxID=5742 RepID=A0A4Z1SV52_GIAMU|nr:hypothetical protein GMRT_11458 [Giardia muris]|eukprot:TNJ29762.1 hypothetical protein GMRT_11458 [Giardia muris]